jgi:DTW domain-containing protein YfiP
VTVAGPDDACEICRRPRAVCVCDRIVSFATERRVLILQHPQEQDALLGSAQILLASLPSAKLVVGLSWRNLAHALGEQDVDPRAWAVLFPDREAPRDAADAGGSGGAGGHVITRRGALADPHAIRGILALDGTWSKAKTLWWRNPWLTKLQRMTLEPSEPSIYGRLRAEPRREYVSTLESVAGALTLCGEPREVEAGLRRAFRTLVQRVRDANLPAEALRLPKGSRSKGSRAKGGGPKAPPKAAPKATPRDRDGGAG